MKKVRSKVKSEFFHTSLLKSESSEVREDFLGRYDPRVRGVFVSVCTGKLQYEWLGKPGST